MTDPVRLYFDTNAIIDAVETPGRSLEDFARVLEAAGRHGIACMTSELSLAELLVKPLKDRDEALIAAYGGLVASAENAQFRTLAVSREILLRAALLRARQSAGLKLPDAIHLATAEASGFSHVVSADRRLAGACSLPVLNPADGDLSAFIEILP